MAKLSANQLAIVRHQSEVSLQSRTRRRNE
jgi:hypothetical protein